MKAFSLNPVDEYQHEPLYALSDEIELTEGELKEKGFLSVLIKDTTEALASQIVSILTKRNKKLSVAESLTGGALSSAIVAQPGASKVFGEGIVAYSNEAKISRLDVSPMSIAVDGPVSTQVAFEMAMRVAGITYYYSLSTTGLAGPTGDDFLDRVGTVYIGLNVGNDVFVKGFLFEGDRTQIRNTTVNIALSMLLTALIQD